MSSNITISSPFIRAFHANTSGASTRAAGNPLFGVSYNTVVPAPQKRIYLLIQNKGTTDVELTLAATGSTIKLYPNQSISLDNYNGAFSVSSYTNVAVIEAFI